jgi:hypothetical protein
MMILLHGVHHGAGATHPVPAIFDGGIVRPFGIYEQSEKFRGNTEYSPRLIARRRLPGGSGIGCGGGIGGGDGPTQDCAIFESLFADLGEVN